MASRARQRPDSCRHELGKSFVQFEMDSAERRFRHFTVIRYIKAGKQLNNLCSVFLVFSHRITLEDELSKVEEVYIVGDLEDYSDGDQIKYPMKLSVTNQTRQIYVRVYGIDNEGNIGSSSNIATIHLTSEESLDPATELSPALFWTLIGIGCAIVLLIIAIIVYFVAKRCSKKRKQNSANTWIEHGNNESPKRVTFNESEHETEFTVNRHLSIISSESSNSSNWSDSVQPSHYSPEESDSQAYSVVPETIEWKNPATYRAARESDARSTSVESIVYAIPTTKM